MTEEIHPGGKCTLLASPPYLTPKAGLDSDSGHNRADAGALSPQPRCPQPLRGAAAPPGPRTAAPGGADGEREREQERSLASARHRHRQTGAMPWLCGLAPYRGPAAETCLPPRAVSCPAPSPRVGCGEGAAPLAPRLGPRRCGWVQGGEGAPRGAEPPVPPPLGRDSSGFACGKGRESARFEVFCPNCCV